MGKESILTRREFFKKSALLGLVAVLAQGCAASGSSEPTTTVTSSNNCPDIAGGEWEKFYSGNSILKTTDEAVLPSPLTAYNEDPQKRVDSQNQPIIYAAGSELPAGEEFIVNGCGTP